MTAAVPRTISYAKKPGRTLVTISRPFRLSVSCICFRGGRGFILLARDVGVCFGAVADDDIRGVLFAIAQVTDLDSGTDVPSGDVVHEIVTILNIATIDRNE